MRLHNPYKKSLSLVISALAHPLLIISIPYPRSGVADLYYASLRKNLLWFSSVVGLIKKTTT